MEKQYLKRLGYGFSALVLGLSAVNFFPAINAYATGDESEQVASSSLSVNVTTPTSTDTDYTISEEPFVVEGTFEGEDLIITVDGEALEASQIEMLIVIKWYIILIAQLENRIFLLPLKTENRIFLLSPKPENRIF